MRKVIFLICLCAFSFPNFSQSLGYEDLAILFSTENKNGTARFNAMGGAFGALGGDLSAISINPAGAAVFNNSMFSGSANSLSSEITSSYYQTSTNTINNSLSLNQAGVVFVFNNYENSNWTKFAFSFNFGVKNDFKKNYTTQGNSGLATFNEFPLDANNPRTQYNTSISQRFNNEYNGKLNEYNFGIAGLYKNNLYVGFNFNSYELSFDQYATLRETNQASNGETLQARYYQQNNTLGAGFSVGIGAIYKVSSNIRFGLSYQSPSWFTEVDELTNIVDNDGFYGDTEISVSGSNTTYSNNVDEDGYDYYPENNFIYQLKTPSKLTLSAAYIFGKNGLLSVDYQYRDFRTVTLGGDDDFTTENNNLFSILKPTNSINVGGEWRVNQLSLRAGYQFEESPFLDAIETDNITKYSLGVGYNFGYLRVDLSYMKSMNTAVYNFYPQYDVQATELNYKNSAFTATAVIDL